MITTIIITTVITMIASPQLIITLVIMGADHDTLLEIGVMLLIPSSNRPDDDDDG